MNGKDSNNLPLVRVFNFIAMIQKFDDIERAMNQYNDDVEREVSASIKTGTWDRERNQVRLEREELQALMAAFQRWQAEVGFGHIPVGVGNKTPPSDRVLVEGWTTMARRFDLEESSYFALYSYPGGRVRRAALRLAEWGIRDPLRTPSARHWQQRFSSNSVIPTVALTEVFAGERNVVIMPHVDLINGYDVFARPIAIKNWGEFLPLKDLPWSEAMKLMHKASLALRTKHEQGKVVAEATLQNLSITKTHVPLWTEAEMDYAPKTLPINRFARDVHTLFVSSWNVLCGHYGETFDPEALAQGIFPVHAPDVLGEIVKVSQADIPWSQKQVFEYLGQFRLGADLKMLNDIQERIRVMIEGILAA